MKTTVIQPIAKLVLLFSVACLLHSTTHSAEEQSPKPHALQNSPNITHILKTTPSQSISPKDIHIAFDAELLYIHDKTTNITTSIPVKTYRYSDSSHLIGGIAYYLSAVNHLFIVQHETKGTLLFNNYIRCYQQPRHATYKSWKDPVDEKYYITDFTVTPTGEIVTRDGTEQSKLWTLGWFGGNPTIMLEKPQISSSINGRSHLDPFFWTKNAHAISEWPIHFIKDNCPTDDHKDS